MLPSLCDISRRSARLSSVSHARSVLREAAASNLSDSVLKRLERRRCAAPSARGEELEGKVEEEPLRVTSNDVNRAYGVACRIGRRWVLKLEEEGFEDAANAVTEAVIRGRFLEEDDSETDSMATELHGVSDLNEKKSHLDNECAEKIPPSPTRDARCGFTPYGKLSRLGWDISLSPRSMGTPLAMMKPHPCFLGNTPDLMSWVKTQIVSIDRMGRRGETMWPFNWDIVDRAARHCVDRLHSLNQKKDWKSAYEVVPKTVFEAMGGAENSEGALDEAAADSREGFGQRADPNSIEESVEGRQAMEGQETASIGADPSQCTITRSGDKFEAPIVLKRKKRRKVAAHKMDTNSLFVGKKEKGRPPSNLSQEQWLWKEVLESFSPGEREHLEREMMHPQKELQQQKGSVSEENSNGEVKGITTADAQSEKPSAIQGALKFLGFIHLWEQTRKDDEDEASVVYPGGSADLQGGCLDGACLERKRKRMIKVMYGAAKRERLGPGRCEQKTNVDKIDLTSRRSKVVIASGDASKREDLDGGEMSMELDLGGCTVEVISKSGNIKKMLEFRSVEASLSYS